MREVVKIELYRITRNEWRGMRSVYTAHYKDDTYADPHKVHIIRIYGKDELHVWQRVTGRDKEYPVASYPHR